MSIWGIGYGSRSIDSTTNKPTQYEKRGQKARREDSREQKPECPPPFAKLPSCKQNTWWICRDSKLEKGGRIYTKYRQLTKVFSQGRGWWWHEFGTSISPSNSTSHYNGYDLFYNGVTVVLKCMSKCIALLNNEKIRTLVSELQPHYTLYTHKEV